jgi:hypothetical protein
MENNITFTKSQSKISKSVIKQDYKYYVVDAERESGKSYLCNLFCSYWGVNEAKASILYYSPTIAHSKQAFKLFINSIEHSEIIKSKNKTQLTVTLVNDTKIYFLGKMDQLCGISLTHCVIDEINYCPDELFKTLFPALVVKGQKIVMFSTKEEGEKQNELFKLYKKHKSKNKMWKFLKMTS